MNQKGMFFFNILKCYDEKLTVSGQTNKQPRLFTSNIFQYIGMMWRVSDKVSVKAKKQQRLCSSNILAPSNAEDKVQYSTDVWHTGCSKE